MTAPAPAAAPARWLSTRAGRTMSGRLVAAIIVGLALATSMTNDRRNDHERGRLLTREKYEKSYEAHRDSLLHVDDKVAPIVMDIAVVFVIVMFVGLFEFTAWLLGYGVGLVDDALQGGKQRRRSRMLDDTDE
jgi:hypothetical protein